MNLEIKKSKNPIKYDEAIRFMEKRLLNVHEGKSNELFWILKHNDIYTAGTSSKDSEILDKKIKVIKTNRGGKITYHGPGQLICYFVIDLKKRNKDIRKFISLLEDTIISTLKIYKINAFADKKNIGIWCKNDHKIEKIAAIGVRVSKWIAYHGFSININNNLKKYDAIIPCGIKNKGVTSLTKIRKQNYDDLEDFIIEKFISHLKNLNA
jgi:lipoyl(octanoyl) transferase